MFDLFREMLSYPFMQRALLVGILVSLCAALLGVSLVLKRYSMIGDGLSHVGFGALAISTALGWAPLAVTIPVVGTCRLSSAAHERKQQDQRGRRNRPDLQQRPCHRCDHRFLVQAE